MPLVSAPPSVSEKRVTVAGTLSRMRRVREAPAARSPSEKGSADAWLTAPEPPNTRRASESIEALSAVPGPVFVIVRIDDSPEKSAFVFVHSFNVNFDEAVLRAGQLAWDLHFRGPAVAYS